MAMLTIVEPYNKFPKKHHVIKFNSPDDVMAEINKLVDTVPDHYGNLRTLHRRFFRLFSKIIKSLDGYLQKEVLNKHSNCIRKVDYFKINDTACPYAYAYVNWLKNVKDLENNWNIIDRYVDRRWTANYSEGAFIEDTLYLNRLLNSWSRLYEAYNISSDRGKGTEWIFSEIITHILYHYFKYCLKVSFEVVEKQSVVSVIPFHYVKIPFYLILLPTDEQQTIEFHWWDL